MLSVEEALELVKQHSLPLAPKLVDLRDAVGLQLAEEIRSDINSPPYDKALMDGYAVRSSDREPERRILEEIAAGDVPRYPVTPRSASRIMTGAPIPDGADAVVQIERTTLVSDSTVRIENGAVTPGQNVLPLGASLRVGDVVLRNGATLRPIEIGVLAEIGHAVVRAIPRPRVAILSTGSELVDVNQTPRPGQIRNSNGPLLAAITEKLGAVAQELGIARDENEELRRLMAEGLTADILVLSGGVSAGKFDLVPGMLAELGVQQVLHKIALRPGKPLWFGVREKDDHRVLVFGLPGNPVSSFVCFELFVRPALSALAGRGFVGLPTKQVTLNHAFRHAGGRPAYLPAVHEPSTGAVEILPWQGSADLATLAKANCLARLGADSQDLAAGASLTAVLI